MNRFLKKNINRVLYRYIKNISDKNKIARITTIISKVFVNKNNELVYDKEYDMYWQKHNDLYLQIDKSPIYDFSYKRYYKRFNSMFCRKYGLNEGDVIIDLGAGIGAELIFYKNKIKDSGKIYAIEASPDSFLKLGKLCNHNKFKNISLHNIAISDKNGSVWIEELDLYKANQINEDSKGKEVKALTLDEFVKENNIEKIDLLKMNIEGAELQVIKGMEKSIGIVNNFAISCHDFLFREETNIKETVSSFFKDNGFEVQEITTGNKYIDSWIYGKRN